MRTLCYLALLEASCIIRGIYDLPDPSLNDNHIGVYAFMLLLFIVMDFLALRG